MAARRRTPEVVGTGELRLIRQGGRFLLTQGDAAVDITRALAFVNNPLGRITLNLRVTEQRRLIAVATETQEVPDAEGD